MSEPVRILYVDDDPALADLVSTFLTRESDRFDVTTTTRVSEGLDRLSTGAFDCVISDYEIPDRNGIEFLEAVRETYPDLPFVLYTGKGSEEIASDAISAGVTDYLQKEGGTSQYAVLANRVSNAVDQHRSKQALEASRKRLSLLIDQSPLGVIEWNDRFECVRLNDTAEGILGYSEAELAGCSWETIVSDADRGRIEEATSALLEDEGGYSTVTENVRKDGERIVCEWHNRVVTDDEGEVVAVFSQFQDVTERTEREDERQRKERQYQAVFNDPNILVGLLDTDGTVLDANRTSIAYVEATREEVIGERFWETPWFAGSDALRTEVEDWVSRAAGGEYVDFEHDIARSDEGTDTVSGVLRPVTNEEGSVVSLLVSARDITERKERERDLERLTERFRTLTEHGSDVITVIDEAGTVQYQSAAVERVLGYEPGELVGESAFEHVHPDDREGAWEAFARTIERPETTTDRFEYRFRHADGSWIWVETVGSNRTDTAVDGYVLTTRDITERKEREHEFQRTNVLLSTLFETLPVGVLAEDHSRDVLAVNQRTFDLFGLPGSPEDVVGADCERMADDVSDLFVDSEAFLERTTELVASSEEADNEELALRDGRVFARSYRSIDLPEGGGHLWMYHDVTDRTERERQIEGLNETARALMTVETEEAVAEIGVEAARDVLNLEANAIHLFDEEESGLVPVTATDALSKLVEEPPTFTGERGSIAWRAYERGESIVVDNARNDPNVYNPETSVRSELHLPIGEYGILIAGSPTREEFTQQDLAIGEILAGSLTTALEQVDRTEQLHARERELARQNKRLNEFTGIVSHDLRNPLTVAAGRLELAREECDSEHFDDIEHAHERMNGLVEDLLTLAREGKRVTETEPVVLADLVRDCWRTVDTAEATIEVETTRTIRADRGRLRQLVENLVRNAVEHGSTSHRSQTRDDAVEHGGDPVRITVGDLEDGFYLEDDGGGIPREDRTTVFESGYSTSAEGTGFGLAIAKQVAEAHGWEIRATEGSTGGARFEITGVDFESS